MNEVMKLIISLSLSGTTLILLLLLFRPLYQERLSKNWQYYIWLVVILRLLLPITPETSLMGTLFRSAEGNLPATTSAPLPRDHEQISIDNLTESGADAEGGQTNAAHGVIDESSISNDRIHDRTSTGRSLTGTFPFVLWLVIALLLVMRKVTIYQSFRKYVDAGCRPIEDLELLECFGHIMEAHHIKGSVDLGANSLVSSPLLIGLFRPRIILPDANLAERDLYYTVLHELTHYRRRDMLYKWLVQFILCLHWFNPCVYLMKNEINRLCELSCDERVIKALSETARKSYGDTLLNAAGTGGSYKDTLASVTLHESKELLKGRLDAIMNYKKLSKIVQFISIFLTGIVIGGAVVLGAYAAPGSRSTADTVHETDAAKSLPDYRIECENNIYYIYVDGADESDKPLSNVTNGFYKLVFVYKDRYTTFGTFRNKDMQNLVRNMKPQCRTMVGNGQIRQDDADLYLLVASDIQGSFLSGEDSLSDNYHFNMYHAYYQKPYIIEFGYNLQFAPPQNAFSPTQITLAGESAIQVYTRNEYTALLEDPTALAAVTAAAERILPQIERDSIPVDSIVIAYLEYVGDTSLSSLAAQYYDKEELLRFSVVFWELDNRTQLQYLDQMFAEENISFFSCCIGAVEDGEAQKEAVERYALRAYQEDNIPFFAFLAGLMDAESRTKWQEQCRKDNNPSYLHLFDDQEDFEDYNNIDGWADDPEDLDALDMLDDLDRLDELDSLDDDFDPDADNLDDYSSSDYPEDRELLAMAEPAIVDLNRVTRAEVSGKVRNALDTCEDDKWYVIEADDCQYIYYNGLSHTYAYEPRITVSEEGDLVTINIADLETDSPLLSRISNYVLLAFRYAPSDPDAEYELRIQYNHVPVTYTGSQAK